MWLRTLLSLCSYVRTRKPSHRKRAIRYDAALIDLPPVRIRELIGNPNVTLARVNEILFIRPQSTATFPLDAEQDDDPAPPQAVERGQCRPLRHYSMVFPSRTTNGCTTCSSSAIPKGSSQPTKWLRASMAPR